MGLQFFRWLTGIAIASAVAVTAWVQHTKETIVNNRAERIAVATNNKLLSKLHSQAEPLKIYTAKNRFNTKYCFMIDMSIESGKNRFFVYDLNNDSIVLSGLVAHGQGTLTTSAPEFSNVAGSYCSSLGRYKIGKPYNGKFGLAYKLYGLDRTNNNAFARAVVLHAHPCVPDDEVAPAHICRSQGCPTVSPAFLQKLKPYVDNAGKPLLLCVYN